MGEPGLQSSPAAPSQPGCCGEAPVCPVVVALCPADTRTGGLAQLWELPRARCHLAQRQAIWRWPSMLAGHSSQTLPDLLRRAGSQAVFITLWTPHIGCWPPLCWEASHWPSSFPPPWLGSLSSSHYSGAMRTSIPLFHFIQVSITRAHPQFKIDQWDAIYQHFYLDYICVYTEVHKYTLFYIFQ